MGAMNRISNYIHPDVNIEAGDTVIFSSKIIPGNEKKLYKLHNQLVRDGIEVISEENEFVHVSGHPSKKELRTMYDWVSPKSLIPVHGEYRHLKEHTAFAKKCGIKDQVLVENGDLVLLDNNKQSIITNKIPTGRKALKGNLIISVDSKYFQNIKLMNSYKKEIFLNKDKK